tara:strand:- start:17500 stop:17799 length:300 start_codon:yes stop_codon:yes gene_type:complete
MEEHMLNALMQGGSNVAFAMFLLWQYKEQQRRSDKREKDLRDRYDKVIVDLQSREDKMREEVVKEISDLDKRMSLLEQSLQNIQSIVEEIKRQFVTIRN